MTAETEAAEVTVQGRRIEVEELPGTEPAIVLLHEGLGSTRLWRGFPEAVWRLTGRRVVAYSRFGHGASDPPPRPRTLSFFHYEALEVLPELLAALRIERPLLIGHSDGASIALIHAAGRPVEGLVLLAPHVFVEEVTVAAIEATRERYVSGELRERMSRHHRDPDAAFWGWCDVWLDPEFRDWTLEAEAAEVAAPALLIQSGEDPYGSLRQLARIEAAARGPVERLVVAGGHSPHLEEEQRVLDALAPFLARLPAPPSA